MEMGGQKFTPGPWVAVADPLGGEGDWMVGSVHGQPDGVAVCSGKDAQLIAASPRLLSALQSFVAAVEDDGEPAPGTRWHREYAEAKAALSAALGEQA